MDAQEQNTKAREITRLSMDMVLALLDGRAGIAITPIGDTGGYTIRLIKDKP